MGRIRTKTTKRASRALIEKYYPRLTLDFQTNKRIIDSVAVVPTKRLRNKIAGFTTRLMRRIQKGPVRGISFKLQEEERERKDNYVPEVSVLSQDTIDIDQDTAELVKKLGFEKVQGLRVFTSKAVQRGGKGPRQEGRFGGARRPAGAAAGPRKERQAAAPAPAPAPAASA